MIVLEQIRAARAMLGLKQHELSQRAGISTGTLNNIERGIQKDPKVSTMRAIQRALEHDGVEFIGEETGRYGIRFRGLRDRDIAATILIVDDNNTDRKLFNAWLRKKSNVNYKIIEATDAKEGYEFFLQHTPNCIVLDFMMYGKNGFQLLMDLKKDHSTIPPIIFVTAAHSETVKKDVLEAGVYSYLDKKTLTQEKFLETISQALLR